MLSHLSVTDGKEVLPSQSPLAPPKNLCFYGKGWHKSEVWKNMFWYTCVNHTKAVCYSVKIKWKNPHNFVSQWTQMKGRRKILAICCFDKSKDFEFCHSTPVFPPRLDLELLIYSINGKCDFPEKFPSEHPRARYSCNMWSPRSWRLPQPPRPWARSRTAVRTITAHEQSSPTGGHNLQWQKDISANFSPHPKWSCKTKSKGARIQKRQRLTLLSILKDSVSFLDSLTVPIWPTSVQIKFSI